MRKNYAIILASGKGERFGENFPKQLMKIKDKTILEYAVEAFYKNRNIDGILIVANPIFLEQISLIFNKKQDNSKIFKIIKGGKTRLESSKIGVENIKDLNSNVLIHDAARPMVSQKIIDNCIEQLKTNKAVVVALKATETIYEVDKEHKIKSIPKRGKIFLAQTPQGFDIKVIKKAYKMIDVNEDFTDDCSIVQKYKLTDIKIIEGEKNNLKITFPIDLKIAQFLAKP